MHHSTPSPRHRHHQQRAIALDARRGIAIHTAERKRIRLRKDEAVSGLTSILQAKDDAARLGNFDLAALFEEQAIEQIALIENCDKAIPISDQIGRRAIEQLRAVVRRIAHREPRQRLPARRSRSRRSHRATAKPKSTADPEGEPPSPGDRRSLPSEVVAPNDPAALRDHRGCR